MRRETGGQALRRLWREQRLAVLLFLGAAALMLFFAVRMMLFAAYWHDPAHRDAVLDGWMTPGYVARSWHVDPGLLGPIVGLGPGEGRGVTLAEIAERKGIPLQVLLDEIAAAIARDRAARGVPGQ